MLNHLFCPTGLCTRQFSVINTSPWCWSRLVFHNQRKNLIYRTSSLRRRSDQTVPTGLVHSLLIRAVFVPWPSAIGISYPSTLWCLHERACSFVEFVATLRAILISNMPAWHTLVITKHGTTSLWYSSSAPWKRVSAVTCPSTFVRSNLSFPTAQIFVDHSDILDFEGAFWKWLCFLVPVYDFQVVFFPSLGSIDPRARAIAHPFPQVIGQSLPTEALQLQFLQYAQARMDEMPQLQRLV